MKPDPVSDRVLLMHILDCIEQVRHYTGGGRETFFNSRMIQDAVLRNLQILAESSQRLSEDSKATQPDIPWRDISGFRNVLAHAYLSIDLDAVWDVVERNLEDLSVAAEKMLLAVKMDGSS